MPLEGVFLETLLFAPLFTFWAARLTTMLAAGARSLLEGTLWSTLMRAGDAGLRDVTFLDAFPSSTWLTCYGEEFGRCGESVKVECSLHSTSHIIFVPDSRSVRNKASLGLMHGWGRY
jgi:hypothetical protein